ncbi:hypothetical protein AUJ66_01905 [Candidatus Desantisbacteria bacterium CG1_02_38_46]|uniref:Uncharacterized protein n=2 Tax=unclassified Candidatus Desantisiibacteriota TaxID=3106372 RepID=A0A2H9PAJ3_9BACT|nr:MAG: hypothetical protein AUJ66_01905 [Candidatus Desantisbacteria bacterium CG1_02_38_46]PIZ15513.1 MAG: hypothetical protein COY51_05010 [Candidatus Desantisbacteria bacterium CG_4_10_14_0_8_um_filter_39_17]
MELAIFIGLWFFFLGMSIYAIRYFLSGGKSFLLGIPSIILFIILIMMFPGVYHGYRGVIFWTLWILILIGILIFFIAVFRK